VTSTLVPPDFGSNENMKKKPVMRVMRLTGPGS